MTFFDRRQTEGQLGGAMNWPASELEQFHTLTWDEIAPQTTPAIRSALEHVLEAQDGACLTDEERYDLANCDAPNGGQQNSNRADLVAFLVAPNALRRGPAGQLVALWVHGH